MSAPPPPPALVTTTTTGTTTGTTATTLSSSLDHTRSSASNPSRRPSPPVSRYQNVPCAGSSIEPIVPMSSSERRQAAAAAAVADSNDDSGPKATSFAHPSDPTVHRGRDAHIRFHFDDSAPSSQQPSGQPIKSILRQPTKKISRSSSSSSSSGSSSSSDSDNYPSSAMHTDEDNSESEEGDTERKTPATSKSTSTSAAAKQAADSSGWVQAQAEFEREHELLNGDGKHAMRRFNRAYARFLRHVTEKPEPDPSGPADGKKKRPRKVSKSRTFDFDEIIPGLLQGKLPRHRGDLAVLRDAGVGAIVSLTEAWEMQPPNTVITMSDIRDSPFAFNHLYLPTPDFSCPASSALRQAVDFVMDHLPKTVVYVHCNAGKSRSAAVCTGVLMKLHGWPAQQAFEFVK